MHHSLVFEITAIDSGFLSKFLELIVTEEVAGVTRIIDGGPRSLTVYECPYRFPQGAKLILEFGRRKQFKVGDRLDVATVLQHPSVKDLILRDASKNGWEKAASRKS